MFVLGLTGGVAMGKSTAAAVFRSLGVPVLDSDREVHRLFAPGGGAVDRIEAAFPGCLTGEGAVDRKRLGARVFDDAAALARLEGIVHPLVQSVQRGWLARQARFGERLVVLDIPLLLEGGGERRMDAVAIVSAPAAVQAQRALRRPGMTPERLAAIRIRQMTDVEKRKHADFVIPTGLGRPRSVRCIEDVVAAALERPCRAWPRRWPLVQL